MDSLHARIIAALTKPMTITQLQDVVGGKYHTITTNVRRMVKTGQVVAAGSEPRQGAQGRRSVIYVRKGYEGPWRTIDDPWGDDAVFPPDPEPVKVTTTPTGMVVRFVTGWKPQPAQRGPRGTGYVPLSEMI